LHTDQAFDLLKKAGITNNPDTFRRWLREGKLKATGFTIDDQELEQFINEHTYPDKVETVQQLKVKIKAKDQYIEEIEETHQSSTQELIKQRDQLNKEILILKNEHTYLDQDEIIRQLKLKIKAKDQYIEEMKKLHQSSTQEILKQKDQLHDEILILKNRHTYLDQNENIRQLKLKIKAKDQYIEGIEELHKSSTQEFIKQRDQLNKEILILKNEQNKLRKEIMDLLRENIELRNRLVELKETGFKENKSDDPHSPPASSLDHYSRKLGLSKMASQKDVLTGFKALLKISHPDQGGDAKLFQYLKNDYDHFRKNIKK
jgi:hypothetical protein